MNSATIKANEAVFRNILRDLKANRSERPAGMYVPEDLETEADIELIIAKYCTSNHDGQFVITDCSFAGDQVIIQFEDVAVMSGGGASLLYSVSGEDVTYVEAIVVKRS